MGILPFQSKKEKQEASTPPQQTKRSKLTLYEKYSRRFAKATNPKERDKWFRLMEIQSKSMLERQMKKLREDK